MHGLAQPSARRLVVDRETAGKGLARLAELLLGERVRVRVRARARARARIGVRARARARAKARVRVKHATSGVSREVREVDSVKSGGAREEHRLKERLLGEARLV